MVGGGGGGGVVKEPSEPLRSITYRPYTYRGTSTEHTRRYIQVHGTESTNIARLQMLHVQELRNMGIHLLIQTSFYTHPGNQPHGQSNKQFRWLVSLTCKNIRVIALQG